MTSWDERFASAAPTAALKRAQSAAGADIEVGEEEDVEVVEAWERIKQAIGFVAARFAAADPNLVSPATLGRMTNPMEVVATQLEAFVEDREWPHLASANESMDLVLDEAMLLPAASTPADVAAIQDAVTRFRQSVGANVRIAQDRIDAVEAAIVPLEQRVADQAAEIEAQKTRLDTAINTTVDRAREAEERRDTAFYTELKDRRSTLDAELEEHRSTLETELDEARTAVSETVQKADSDLQGILSETREAGRTHMEELDKMRQQAERLMAAIGSTGLTGGYQRQAELEKKAADRWRTVAARALLGAVAVAAIIVALEVVTDAGYLFDVDFSFWEWNGARLTVAIPLLAISIYAIAESTQHRHRERDYRRAELQLAALEPFLAEFDAEKRNAAREKMLDRFWPGVGRWGEVDHQAPE